MLVSKERAEVLCGVPGCGAVCKVDRNTTSTELLTLSNFFKHVRKQHPGELTFDDLRKIEKEAQHQAEKAVAKVNSGASSKNKGGATASTGKSPFSIAEQQRHAKQQRRDMLLPLVRAVAHGPFPVSLANNAAVRALLQAVQPECVFPDRRQLATRLKAFLREERTETTAAFCVSVHRPGSKLSATIDCSSSAAKNPYAAMTLHAVQRGGGVWTLREHIHDCSFFAAPHNRATIAAKVLQQLHLFPPFLKITKPEHALRSITYDCASCNTAFEDAPAMDKIKCFGHRLNTLCEHLHEKSLEWQDSVALILDIGKTIKNSALNREHFAAIQRQRGRKHVLLPRNLARTRFADHVLSLHRMQDIRMDVAAMKVSEMYFAAPVNANAQQWLMDNQTWNQRAAAISTVLSVLNRVVYWLIATQGGTGQPSISLVLYAIQDITACAHSAVGEFNARLLQDVANLSFNKEGRSICRALLREIEVVFPKWSDIQHLRLARLFDPRVATSSHAEAVDHAASETSADSSAALEQTLALFRGIPSWKKEHIGATHPVENFLSPGGDDNGDSSGAGSSGGAAAPKRSKFARLQDSIVDTGGVHASARAKHEAALQSHWEGEFKVYLDLLAKIDAMSVKEQQQMNTLQFWAENEAKMPLLADCAAAILAQPAQAAASERVFSALSRVVTKLRCRLNRDTAGQLVVSSMRERSRLNCEKEGENKPLEPFPPFGDISEGAARYDATDLDDLDGDWDSDSDDMDEDNNDVELEFCTDRAMRSAQLEIERELAGLTEDSQFGEEELAQYKAFCAMEEERLLHEQAGDDDDDEEEGGEEGKVEN